MLFKTVTKKKKQFFKQFMIIKENMLHLHIYIKYVEITFLRTANSHRENICSLLKAMNEKY